MNTTITSIEVKREQRKYYAQLYHKHQAVARSGLFNTAAGATMAGKMLASQKKQKPFLL